MPKKVITGLNCIIKLTWWSRDIISVSLKEKKRYKRMILSSALLNKNDPTPLVQS